MSRNNDYTKGNLINYQYHHNFYKLIVINFPRQTSPTIRQQINFIEKLDEINSTKIFLITEKKQKTFLDFPLDSLSVKNNINNGISKNIDCIE